MSYSINALSLRQKDKATLPTTKGFEVVDEHTEGCGRFYEYPFMTMQKGIWYSFIKDMDNIPMASYGMCDANFDLPDESRILPYWVSNRDTLYDLRPLVIYDKYYDDFKKVLLFIKEQSPIGRLMFLAQMQGTYEEVICGSISMDSFWEMLNNNQILFNVCYIIS